MLAKKLQAAVAGQAAGGAATYVEDVFSTYLYTGNNSNQTITNGIDLAGEGGMVWFKCRSTSYGSMVFDSERGDFDNYVSTFDTGGNNWAGDLGWSVGTFNSDGFTVPYGTNPTINGSGQTFASWTFRKAPKFFDIVTYTGTGASGNAISHNLGSTPGAIIIKRTNSTGDWNVWHRSTTGDLWLNLTDGQDGGKAVTNVTDSSFTVGTSETTHVNASGSTYVAYLFAHDAGGFGDDGDQSIIKCGSYTGDGTAGGPLVNLGWEPQWILTKKASASGAWILSDSMRGLGAWDGVSSGGISSPLFANSASAEDVGGDYPAFTSTGYYPTNQSGNVLNASGATYVYIAIRRGPMKAPDDATKVFTPLGYTGTGTSSSRAVTGNGGVVDTVWHRSRIDTFNWNIYDKGRGPRRLVSNSSDSEVGAASYGYISNFALMDGYNTVPGGVNNENFNKTSSTFISWNFTRAAGFHDVVYYTGTGSNQNITHNLGVTPELVIIKSRSNAYNWAVWHKDLGGGDYALQLNNTGAKTNVYDYWNGSPTSSVFGLGTDAGSNNSGSIYVAYLFASVPGVSKVGSFTGNGSSLTVDCGFSNGARFVLIKRADSTSGWYVWDTARGIVASAADPRLRLENTSAEISGDDIDPDSSGFIAKAAGNINVSGATYIFLAIA